MSGLRLMTYNVRYFGHGTRGVFATRAGLERVADRIAALDPLVDVVCLQEVEQSSLRASLSIGPARRRRTQLGALLAELERALGRRGIRDHYRAYYFPAHTYRLTRSTNLFTTGLAILVRPRLRVLQHDAGSVVDITHRRVVKSLKQTRICAHLTVEGDGLGRLDVFNTHMSLPGPLYPEFWLERRSFGFGPNQVAEARRLSETIRHRRRSDHVVLVGDFNSEPGSPVDRLLREEAGLVDAMASWHGMASERLSRWSTAGFMRKRMNIDRIYSSPGVRWLDFEGSRPYDEHDGADGFGGLSDHVPLLGTLRL
jgi:endonuclease/exonuclease/phosphatase family metal-dependent hydrolase